MDIRIHHGESDCYLIARLTQLVRLLESMPCHTFYLVGKLGLHAFKIGNRRSAMLGQDTRHTLYGNQRHLKQVSSSSM